MWVFLRQKWFPTSIQPLNPNISLNCLMQMLSNPSTFSCNSRIQPPSNRLSQSGAWTQTFFNLAGFTVKTVSKITATKAAQFNSQMADKIQSSTLHSSSIELKPHKSRYRDNNYRIYRAIFFQPIIQTSNTNNSSLTIPIPILTTSMQPNNPPNLASKRSQKSLRLVPIQPKRHQQIKFLTSNNRLPPRLWIPSNSKKITVVSHLKEDQIH